MRLKLQKCYAKIMFVDYEIKYNLLITRYYICIY